MGRLERKLDQQKVEQLLATGKFEVPRSYPKPEPQAPNGKWPTPAYLRKLARRRRKRVIAYG